MTKNPEKDLSFGQNKHDSKGRKIVQFIKYLFV
jgi:hypothetical protein